MSRITPHPENLWYRIDPGEGRVVVYDQDLGYALDRAVDSKGYSKHHKVYRLVGPNGKWEHYDPNSLNLYQMMKHVEQGREKLVDGQHRKDDEMLQAANAELHFVWCAMQFQTQPR